MIDLLTEWVRIHQPALERHGVCMVLKAGPADIPVPWASIFFETDTRLAQLLLGATGLADLEVVDPSTGVFLLNEHRELQSAADLEQALWTLVDAIAPSYRASHV